MEKKSILSIFLLISIVMFSSLAIASEIVLTGTSVVSPFNVTNASNGPSGGIPVLALKVWDNGSSTLDSVVVSVGNLTEDFSGDGDLATLGTGSSSGLQIYKDSNSNGVYESGTDARLTYLVTDWSSNTNNMQNVTFSSISGLTLPSTVPSTANVFVVIKMVATPSNGAQFNVSVLKGAVKSSGNATGTVNSTDVSSGRVYIDTLNPSIAAGLVNAQVNDTDRDGYVDQARLLFNENVNDSIISITGMSIGNLSNFTVSTSSGGYLMDGLTFWTGGTANDNELYVNFTENTLIRYTNQSFMTFNYSTNGTVKDMAGNSLQTITNRVLGDGAAPILLNITTNDTVLDGKVDALVLTFSEPINDTLFNMSASPVASLFSVANATWTGGYVNDAIMSINLSQSNTTKDGNFTGHFNATYGRVGIVADLSALNDGLANESKLWVGNITLFAIIDRVSPVLERFETLDTDNNGWLDAIRINLSESINDSTINQTVVNLFSVTLATGTNNETGASANMTGQLNFTATYASADSANNNFILFNFSEQFAKLNTSAGFALTYTSIGNGLCDFASGGVNCLVTNGTNASTGDKAPPVIMNGLTYNLTINLPFQGLSSNDSTIDYINLTLSERVTAGTTASSSFSLSVNTVNGSGIGNVLVLGTNNVTVASISANVTIGLNGLVVGTGNVTLNYSVVAGASINDSNGNTMIAKNGILITDNVRPVLYQADYLDNDSNGWVDAVRLNFTEPMNFSSLDAAVNKGVPSSRNFSIKGISTDLGGNINFTTEMNNTGNITGGVSSIVFLYWAGANRTHNTSPVLIMNISGVAAAAQSNTTPNGGNPLSDTSGRGFEVINETSIADKAAPVIMNGIAYDVDADGKIGNINLTLSEYVNSGQMNTSAFSIVVTDGTITGRNILTPVGVGITVGANVTISFADSVVGTGNVTLNYTMPSTGGNFNDTVGNLMDNKFSFAIIDNVTPKLLARNTMDNDSNGWVEMIQLNFSEEINDSSVAQQIDQLLAGFAGKNINFSVEIISRDGDPAINWTTGSVANDALIYINWSTTNATLNSTYNTSATPRINYTKGIISDTIGNFAETNASTASTRGSNSADNAAPVIMHKYTIDNDSNGYLDAVAINFSENINDSTVVSTDFNISLISGNGVAVDFTWNYHGDSGNNTFIYLNWSFVNTQYKTNGTPTVNYTSGSLKDLASRAEISLATSTSGLNALDRAVPRIMNVTTVDNNSNGWLEMLQVYWSEPVNDNSFKAFDFNVSGVGYATASGLGVVDSHILNFTTGTFANDDIIFVNWSINNTLAYSTVHNTGATPAINYTAGNLSDLANNLAATNTTPITALDRATPKVMDIFTVDNNTNGYLDAVGINWSENINDQTFGNVTNFNISLINSIAAAVRVDFTTNYHGDALNNNVIYLNWSYASTTFNTSGRPLVNYSAGNLSDTANNLAPSNTTSITAADRASPVIWSAVASDNTTGSNSYDSDDTVTITFSEQINNASVGNASPYIVNGTNAEGIEALLAINGTKKWNNISSALWINSNQTLVITVYNQNYTNISVGDVITPNGTLRDVFGNIMGQGNNNATLTGTFDDTIAPYLTNVQTYDNDSDGKIDQIKITLNEAVINKTNATVATTFRTGFTVEGFTIAASQNDSGTVIVLNLTETSINTSIRPWVAYNSGIGNLTDLGTNANKLATFNVTANDSAVPVPVNVSTYDNDSDGFIDLINVTFSEQVNDSSINRSNINWTDGLGNDEIGITGFNTGTGFNDSYVEFTFTDNKNNTGALPFFLSNGTGSSDSLNFILQDMAAAGGGNFLKTVTNNTVTETDGAKPVFMPLNITDGNFSNITRMGSNNVTTLWFNVSESVTRISVVVGNVTATLQNNESTFNNFTYRLVPNSSNSIDTTTATITISALDTSGLNATNATQSAIFDYTPPVILNVTAYDRPNDDGSHIKVMWGSIPVSDFLRYNIYIDVVNSSSLSGKTPHNSTITNNATVRNLIATINTSNLTNGAVYYIAVTAVDLVGNENQTVVMANATPYDNSQISPTANQWNLVSTTQTLANTTKGATLNSSYTVYWYNDSASAWASAVTLDQYKGYWLYDNGVGSAINLSFKNNAGPSPTLAQQNLTLGWNLIGSSREADLPINTTLNSIAGKYSVVYEYTVGTGWRTYTAGATTTNSATEFLNMTAGRGYWVFMTSAGTYSGGDL
ncbi:hypothetical protein HZA96_04895 [Candidatus Woesearchaeota archaeon]|nr:hypothetical protein [Candidatus Woesearchaeota archaeon]